MSNRVGCMQNPTGSDDMSDDPMMPAGEPLPGTHKRSSMSAFYGIKETADVADFVYIRPMSAESTSSSGSAEICRICLDGRKAGFLARPCRCKGTSAFVHLPCLKEWLLHSNSSRCELCRYKFKTRRKWKPLREWVVFSLSPENNAYLKIIVVITILLFIFTLAGVYLCTDVGRSGRSIKPEDVPAWKVMSISVLSLCSGALYVIGTLYCCCRCGGVWREWAAKNQTMTILLPRRVMAAWSDPGQYFTAYSEVKRPGEENQSQQALNEEPPQCSMGNDVTGAEQNGVQPGSSESADSSPRGDRCGWARVPRLAFIRRSNSPNVLLRYFLANRSRSVTPELIEIDEVPGNPGHDLPTDTLFEMGIL